MVASLLCHCEHQAMRSLARCAASPDAQPRPMRSLARCAASPDAQHPHVKQFRYELPTQCEQVPV